MRPVYFQIQYGGESVNTHVHSDGCCPIEQDFREFAHKLLDEFLDAYQKGEVTENSQDILDGSHVIFAPCTVHGH